MSSKRPVKVPAWCSQYSVHGRLAKLSGYRRVDRGGEMLAFRVAGDSPARSVYIYLYGDDPAAPPTKEQLLPQFALELADVLRQRRLGRMDFLRRQAEALFPGNGEKDLKLAQRHSGFPYA